MQCCIERKCDFSLLAFVFAGRLGNVALRSLRYILASLVSLSRIQLYYLEKVNGFFITCLLSGMLLYMVYVAPHWRVKVESSSGRWFSNNVYVA